MSDLCERCGKPYQIGDWPFCGPSGHGRPHGRQGGVAHTSERAVVWRHPGTGTIAYPPTNNEAMPDYYRNWGYERHELPTLRSIENFEKEQNVRSEVAWHDKGTGSADYVPDHKPIDLTGISIGVKE